MPVIPTREFFEYHHASGEVHIRNDDVWVACPGMLRYNRPLSGSLHAGLTLGCGIGQDNPSDQCSTGAVTFSTADVADHGGPFDGVSMGVC